MLTVIVLGACDNGDHSSTDRFRVVAVTGFRQSPCEGLRPPGPDTRCVDIGDTVFDQDDVESAESSLKSDFPGSEPTPRVMLQLTDEAGQALDRYAAANLQGYFAVFVGDRLVAMPKIYESDSAGGITLQLTSRDDAEAIVEAVN